MDESTNDSSKNEPEEIFLEPEEIAKTETKQPIEPPADSGIEKLPAKRSRKPLLIVAVVVVLLSIAAGVWLFLRDRNSKVEPATTNTALETPATNQVDNLFAVAYGYGDAEKIGMEIFWRPVAGGERRSAKNIGQKNYPGESGVYENKVFITTTPSNGSSDGAMIWYSSDSGKTYEELVSLGLPDPDKLGDQITSVVFSKDGKKLAYGLYPEDRKTSIVKEVDLETNESRDLLTVAGQAVFLQGYDSEASKVYYHTGCYNCDGNVRNELFEYDVAAKKEVTLYSLTDNTIGIRRMLNKQYTKLLVLEGSESTDGIEGGPPYSLKEFDMTSKTFKELSTLDSEAATPHIGYTNDQLPYYTQDKTLYVIKPDNTKQSLYDAPSAIEKVLYVGGDTVIAASGSFEDYALLNYALSTKQSVEILKGDQSTYLFGVTTKLDE